MYQETEAAVLTNTKKLFGALSLKILWAAVGPGTITAQALGKVHGIGVSSAKDDHKHCSPGNIVLRKTTAWII